MGEYAMGAQAQGAWAMKDVMISRGTLAGHNLRDAQVRAVDFIGQSDKRFLAINGPTGVGKTILAMEAMQSPLFYLCSSKALQAQFIRDYPEASLLQGRSNYACLKFDDASGCIGMKGKCPDCAYSHAKSQAMANPFTTLNFHYFLSASNYAGFAARDSKAHEGAMRNIIIDEADDMEGTLTNFISFEFSIKQLERVGLYIGLPKHRTVIDCVPPWLTKLGYMVGKVIADIKDDVDGINEGILKGMRLDSFDRDILRKYARLQGIATKVHFLNTQTLDESAWVYYHNGERVVIKPKWLTRALTDTFLFTHGARFLFMSATLPAKPVLEHLMGLASNELDYLDLPSPYDIAHRPVRLCSSYTLTKANYPGDKAILDAVDSIVQANPSTKGIIHTVTFKLAKLLYDGLSNPRLIYHGLDEYNRANGVKDKDSQFQSFLASSNGIWVSPSSVRGIDLANDLARWCIFLKCPYLDLGDPLTKARAYSGPKGKAWYVSQAIQSIVQGAGRIVRNENDYGTTYILDAKVNELIQRNAILWPRWFRDALVYGAWEEETGEDDWG